MQPGIYYTFLDENLLVCDTWRLNYGEDIAKIWENIPLQVGKTYKVRSKDPKIGIFFFRNNQIEKGKYIAKCYVYTILEVRVPHCTSNYFKVLEIIKR